MIYDYCVSNRDFAIWDDITAPSGAEKLLTIIDEFLNNHIKEHVTQVIITNIPLDYSSYLEKVALMI